MKKTFIPGMPCVGVFPDIEGNGGSPGTEAAAAQKTHFRGRGQKGAETLPCLLSLRRSIGRQIALFSGNGLENRLRWIYIL